VAGGRGCGVARGGMAGGGVAVAVGHGFDSEAREFTEAEPRAFAEAAFVTHDSSDPSRGSAIRTPSALADAVRAGSSMGGRVAGC
jgi:hypothetical protein